MASNVTVSINLWEGEGNLKIFLTTLNKYCESILFNPINLDLDIFSAGQDHNLPMAAAWWGSFGFLPFSFLHLPIICKIRTKLRKMKSLTYTQIAIPLNDGNLKIIIHYLCFFFSVIKIFVLFAGTYLNINCALSAYVRHSSAIFKESGFCFMPFS